MAASSAIRYRMADTEAAGRWRRAHTSLGNATPAPGAAVALDPNARPAGGQSPRRSSGVAASTICARSRAPGLVLALSGREVAGGIVCPFHRDSRPSLHVRADDGGWFCHGCGRGGGVLEFFAGLQGREVPTDRHEFARLASEITDALRGLDECRPRHPWTCGPGRTTGPSPRRPCALASTSRARRSSPHALANGLRKNYPTATGGRQLYAFRNGVYRPEEDFLRQQIATRLGSDGGARRADETISHLMQGSPRYGSRHRSIGSRCTTGSSTRKQT